MSALKCCKLQARIFLEIGNISFGSWAPFLRVIYLIKLIWLARNVMWIWPVIMSRGSPEIILSPVKGIFSVRWYLAIVRYFIYYFPASEKRAFLLYYATPLLSRYLPSDHHLFLMLLTGGMFRLLKQSISQEELHEAHTYLRLFTAQAPFFFGKHYNV